LPSSNGRKNKRNSKLLVKHLKRRKVEPLPRLNSNKSKNRSLLKKLINLNNKPNPKRVQPLLLLMYLILEHVIWLLVKLSKSGTILKKVKSISTVRKLILEMVRLETLVLDLSST